MLQIDHVYEFLFKSLFKDFDLYHFFNGVVSEKADVLHSHLSIFTPGRDTTVKIFCYDQEPILENISEPYLDLFSFPNCYSIQDLQVVYDNQNYPYGLVPVTEVDYKFFQSNPQCLFKNKILFVSEESNLVNSYKTQYNLKLLYYFFHGYAALDWFRGFYALNYSKHVVQQKYTFDYVTFNRLVSNDRSYRCYFVSKLVENNLLNFGQISFGLDDEHGAWHEELLSQNSKLSNRAKLHINKYMPTIDIPLIIDSHNVAGSASADIPRCINDSFWHVVTETVFYYDKLHLTEKIFKPIVMKQPFMLLAAPGNLAYLKRYGFKTFDKIIDEGYDAIQDPDERVDAVVKQLHWYCNLSHEEKAEIIKEVAPIVEYNFHHFYGEFKHIITTELLENCKTLFKEIGYDDSNMAYKDIYKVLTT